ncbi:MAG: sigma-54-dependent Fis family transcriptional regulator [Polyangiaceae bacterium]|nr:sigma-54-dependent Fis family transcriptional regulator [Myxococcales bacterium]MCB9588603.1 sigma-54-dependent Fis family transcriptional regulator [Polyangiaceae bacterium]
MLNPSVAIVDEDPLSRELLRLWLEAAGYDVLELASAAELLSRPILPEISCVSLTLSDTPGDALIGTLKARDPDRPALLISSLQAPDAVARALGCGAYDVLSKPLVREQVLLRVKRAAEVWRLKSRVKAVCGAADLPPSLWGRSPAIKGLLGDIDAEIHGENPLIVVGEAGSGRAAVARFLHVRGLRSGETFVSFNCAELPPARHFEELFGDHGGGAESLFARAAGGVLYIHDVGWLAAEAQQELVDALRLDGAPRSSRRPSGGWAVADVTTRPASFAARSAPRLICSSSVEVPVLARTGQLSEALASLFEGSTVSVPPLRERRDDIPELLSYWVRRLSVESGRPSPRIAASALEALLDYSWPGNVHELSQVVQRAILASDGASIQLNDLPIAVRQMFEESERDSGLFEPTRDDNVVPLRELERRAIAHALKVADGNVGHAARLLGIGRATLYRRLAEQAGSRVG